MLAIFHYSTCNILNLTCWQGGPRIWSYHGQKEGQLGFMVLAHLCHGASRFPSEVVLSSHLGLTVPIVDNDKDKRHLPAAWLKLWGIPVLLQWSSEPRFCPSESYISTPPYRSGACLCWDAHAAAFRGEEGGVPQQVIEGWLPSSWSEMCLRQSCQGQAHKCEELGVAWQDLSSCEWTHLQSNNSPSVFYFLFLSENTNILTGPMGFSVLWVLGGVGSFLGVPLYHL